MCLLEDGDASTFPTSSAERLAALLSWKAAWESFKPRNYDILPTEELFDFNMHHDVLVMETANSGNDIELWKYTPFTSFSQPSGFVTRLDQPVLHTVFHHDSIGYVVNYYDWDHEFCVVAMCEFAEIQGQYYIKHLSDGDYGNRLPGAPFFDARQVARSVTGEDVYAIGGFMTPKPVIYGELLFVHLFIGSNQTTSKFYNTLVPFVAIWNWESGALLASYVGDDSIQDVKLLSPTSFVVVSCQESVGCPAASIQLFTFGGDGDGPSARLIRTFNLPMLPDNSSTAPFLSDSDHQYTFVFPASILSEPFDPRFGDDDTVSWEQWGVHSACIHTTCYTEMPRLAFSDSRVIFLEQFLNNTGHSDPKLLLLDFNIRPYQHSIYTRSWPIARGAADEESERCNHERGDEAFPLQVSDLHQGFASLAPNSLSQHLFSGCDDWIKVPGLAFTTSALACPVPRIVPSTPIIMDSERVIIQVSAYPTST
ncbi:hypothetical protein DL93DRAFT_2231453 [Clavulina sp. PMI_390]|nr:hypothetical protein DL93DRAFT_2231453 [Clavulina sp. PMI_390]